jgi:hypothetical protein
MRPKTLAEVAELALAGETFDLGLRNFLDEFYLHPSSAALEAEPPRMKEAFQRMGEVQDAYLAATAEELARKSGLDCPSWAYDASRKLRDPWFAMNLAALRAVLLLESPAGFRSRNLFVSENALSRV